MAFYGYNDDDAGEYHWTPNFNVSYDYDAFPMSYPSYGQSTNYNYYHTTQIHPQFTYSVHNSVEPKLIQYEKGTDSLETRTVISCYTKELDDTQFDEYDPTPYDGGFDMAQTYGKPLPPSNEICYPRSTLKSNGLPLDGFDYGSNNLPYVNHANQLEQLQNQKKGNGVKDEQKSSSGVKEKTSFGKPAQQDEDFVIDNGKTGEKPILEKPVEPLQQDQDFVVDNGSIGEYGYDYGRQLQQIPYGSGLESMDLCESLFGYWPCIAKETQRRNCNCANVVEDNSSSYNEQWKCTADYLFGNPYGYGGDGGDWDCVYSNQSYYNHQQQL